MYTRGCRFSFCRSMGSWHMERRRREATGVVDSNSRDKAVGPRKIRRTHRPCWVKCRWPFRRTNWARRDSNPRPIDYESTALTAELQALEFWERTYTVTAEPPHGAPQIPHRTDTAPCKYRFVQILLGAAVASRTHCSVQVLFRAGSASCRDRFVQRPLRQIPLRADTASRRYCSVQVTPHTCSALCRYHTRRHDTRLEGTSHHIILRARKKIASARLPRTCPSATDSPTSAVPKRIGSFTHRSDPRPTHVWRCRRIGGPGSAPRFADRQR